jgi:GNAT superfamily N-acetyltransferase
VHHDASWREVVRLDDGTQVVLRLVRPDDKALIERAFGELSPESRFLRFFAAKTSLTPDELAYLTEMDQQSHLALGATTPDGAEGLGIARFIRVPERPETAEAAVVVAEHLRQRGLGRRLLEHLVAAAQERGVERFRGEVLARNAPMRGFVDLFGEPAAVEGDGEVLTYEWALPPPSEEATTVRKVLQMAGQGLLVLRHTLFPWTASTD